NG
ncbi:hypothetical protein BV129_01116B, partial [Haemophilus influenzae]